MSYQLLFLEVHFVDKCPFSAYLQMLSSGLSLAVSSSNGASLLYAFLDAFAFHYKICRSSLAQNSHLCNINYLIYSYKIKYGIHGIHKNWTWPGLFFLQVLDICIVQMICFDICKRKDPNIDGCQQKKAEVHLDVQETEAEPQPSPFKKNKSMGFSWRRS